MKNQCHGAIGHRRGRAFAVDSLAQASPARPDAGRCTHPLSGRPIEEQIHHG